MDDILAKASNQAVSFAIRSGISIASGYAIRTMTKMMDRIPESEKNRLVAKRNSLQRKISALSVSLDLIKLAAARGNSVLDATVELVDDLKQELDLFDATVAELENDHKAISQKDSVALIESKMDALRQMINEAIPLINLSLITSGVNLTNVMQPRISASRLLQAANRINASNIAFGRGGGASEVQVGPTFDLRFYSVFYNPSRLKYIEERPETSPTTGVDAAQDITAVLWKEEFARAECRLVRVPGDSFKYQLLIIESFDDGRYHDDDEKPKRRVIPVEEIKKLYFSASGRLLRLEGSDLPVLILKTNKDVTEYVGLGETDEETDSDSSSEDSDNFDGEEKTKPDKSAKRLEEMSPKLSLLEYLIRLCALQSEEQSSILEISDEKLLLYLQDEVDSAVLPQSRESRASLAAQKFKTSQLLEKDSTMNRLSKLKIDD